MCSCLRVVTSLTFLKPCMSVHKSMCTHTHVRTCPHSTKFRKRYRPFMHRLPCIAMIALGGPSAIVMYCNIAPCANFYVHKTVCNDFPLSQNQNEKFILHTHTFNTFILQCCTHNYSQSQHEPDWTRRCGQSIICSQELR